MKHVDEIIEDFELFDDWEQRYAYLIDLGKTLKPMDEALKTEENFVKGCTSQVWMVLNDEDGKIFLMADSDALIVKGLIGLLIKIYSGQTLHEAQAIDMEDAFTKLGLDEHLSPNRRNGFFSMVEKIKRFTAR